jgi:uncharacterized RDD family membrane protein YckC
MSEVSAIDDAMVVASEEPTSKLAKPWARFWARVFDLHLLSYVVGFVSGLLWPALYAPDSFLMQLPTVATGIILLPFIMVADALVLALFGTTLGKLIAGIRVEPLKGKRISVGAALMRNAELYVKGLALGMPIVCLFTYTQGYNTVSDRQRPSWDKRTSVRVVDRGSNTFRVVVIGVMAVLLIASSTAFNVMSKLSY